HPADYMTALADAMPTAVAKAMRRAIPEQYSPQVAQKIAADVVARLTRRQLLTEAQRTFTFDEGLGAWRTGLIETTARDIDDNASTADNAVTPLFSAEMVRHTEDYPDQQPLIWFGYGASIGTVTRKKGRTIAATMREFADRLEALCDLADEVAAGDREARA
ncbi:hypothetical protein NGM37_36555, partial [Streptomyces sp. TRM76130]|nr:hypothetical protein [Streptomyces sp. TRM76130]